MNTLHQFLTEASRHYYNGNPIISDEAFDRLSESCGFDNLGSGVTGDTQTHYFPMYSLQKWYEDEGKPSPLHDYKDVCVTGIVH
jgi:hypothetical protein